MRSDSANGRLVKDNPAVGIETTLRLTSGCNLSRAEEALDIL